MSQGDRETRPCPHRPLDFAPVAMVLKEGGIDIEEAEIYPQSTTRLLVPYLLVTRFKTARFSLSNRPGHTFLYDNVQTNDDNL